MSSAAVVIIIGGGTQQNRTAETVEQDGETIRIRLNGEGSVADQLRHAADLLDGA
jgi:hypothetical protein